MTRSTARTAPRTLTDHSGREHDAGQVADWWAHEPVAHAFDPRQPPGSRTLCGWGVPRERIPLRLLLRVARPCRRCFEEPS